MQGLEFRTFGCSPSNGDDDIAASDTTALEVAEAAFSSNVETAQAAFLSHAATATKREDNWAAANALRIDADVAAAATAAAAIVSAVPSVTVPAHLTERCLLGEGSAWCGHGYGRGGGAIRGGSQRRGDAANKRKAGGCSLRLSAHPCCRQRLKLHPIFAFIFNLHRYSMVSEQAVEAAAEQAVQAVVDADKTEAEEAAIQEMVDHCRQSFVNADMATAVGRAY